MSGESVNASSSDRSGLSGKQTNNKLFLDKSQTQSSLSRSKTAKLLVKISRKKSHNDNLASQNGVTDKNSPILDDNDTITPYAPFPSDSITNSDNHTSSFGNKASYSLKKFTSSTMRIVDPTSPSSQLNNFFKSLSPGQDIEVNVSGFPKKQSRNSESLTLPKDSNTNLPVVMTNGKSRSPSALTSSSAQTIITDSIKEEDEECDNINSLCDKSNNSVDDFQSVLEFPKLTQNNETKSDYSSNNNKNNNNNKVTEKAFSPRIARSFESLKVRKKNSLPELKIGNQFQSKTIFKNSNINSSYSSNSSSKIPSPKTPSNSATMSSQFSKIRKKLSVVAKSQNSVDNLNEGVSALTENNDKTNFLSGSNMFPIMRHTNSSSSSVKTTKSKSSASRASTSSAKSWDYRNFRTITSGTCNISPNNSTTRVRSNSLNNNNLNSNFKPDNSNSSPISSERGFFRNRIRSNSLNSPITVEKGTPSVINISNGRRINNNTYSLKRLSNNSMASLTSSRLSPRSSVLLMNNTNNDANHINTSYSRRSSHLLNSADEVLFHNGLFISYDGNSNTDSKPSSPNVDSNSRVPSQNIFSLFSDQIDSTESKNCKTENGLKNVGENTTRRRSKTLNSLVVSSSSFSSPSQTHTTSSLTQSTGTLHSSSQRKRINDNINNTHKNIRSDETTNRVISSGLNSSRLKLNTNSSSLTVNASTFFEEPKIRSRSGSFIFSPSFLRSSSHGTNSTINSYENNSSTNCKDSTIDDKDPRYGIIISQVRRSLESKLLPAQKMKGKFKYPKPEDSVITYLCCLIEEGFSYEIVDILTSKIQIKKHLSKQDKDKKQHSIDMSSTSNDAFDAFKNFNDSQIENLMDFKFGNNHTAPAQSIFYKKCLYFYTFLYFINLFFNSDRDTNGLNDFFPAQESILDYQIPYLDLISSISSKNGDKIYPMNNSKTKKIQSFFMNVSAENFEESWINLQKELITKFPLDMILRHFLFFNMLPKETEKIDLILQVLAYNYKYFINLSHLKSVWRFVENRPTYDDSNISDQSLDKVENNYEDQSDSDSLDDYQSTNEEFLDDTVIIHSPPHNGADKSSFNLSLANATSENLTIINSTTDIYTLLFILLVLQTDHFNKSNKSKMSIKDFTSIIRNFQKEDKSKLTLSLFQSPEIIEYFYCNVTATPLKSLIEMLCQIPYVEQVVQAGSASIAKKSSTNNISSQQHSSTRSNSIVSSLLSPTSPSFGNHGNASSSNSAMSGGLMLSSSANKRKSSFFSSSNASLNILGNQSLTIDPYSIHSPQNFSSYTVANNSNKNWVTTDFSGSSNSGNPSFFAPNELSHDNFFEECFSDEFFQLFLHSEISTTPPIILKVDNSFDIGASASSILAIPNNSKLKNSFKLGNEKIPMFSRIFQIGILLKKNGINDSASSFINQYDSHEKQQHFVDSHLQLNTRNSEFSLGNEQYSSYQSPPITAGQSINQSNQSQSGYLSKKASISKMKAKVKMNFGAGNPSSSIAYPSHANGHTTNSSKANSMDDWTKCCAVLSSLGLSVFRNVNFELLEEYINGNEGKSAINILHSSMLLIGNAELESFIPAENLFAVNLNSDDSGFQVGWAQKTSSNSTSINSEFIKKSNILKENFKCPEGASLKWVNLINVIGAYSNLALDSRNKNITSLHVPGYPNIFELRTDRQVAVDFSYKTVLKEIQSVDVMLVELERIYNFATRLIPFTSKCRSVIENLVTELLPSKRAFLVYRKTILNTRLFLLSKLQGSDGINNEKSAIHTNKKKDIENRDYHKFEETCDILSVLFSDVILKTRDSDMKHCSTVVFDDILPDSIDHHHIYTE